MRGVLNVTQPVEEKERIRLMIKKKEEELKKKIEEEEKRLQQLEV